MRLAVALLIIDAMFMWHAVKTGRSLPWAFIILVPVIGIIAYLALEIWPEWLSSARGRKLQIRFRQMFSPDKRYRALTSALAMADTVATRAALANECLARGRFAEAEAHYETILKSPQGDEPVFAFGQARALFGLGESLETIAVLDALRARWPEYQSAEAHLLYARALEESGQAEAAIAEYRALAEYHSGAEARVRFGLLLRKLGRTADAKVAFAEVVAGMQRQPRFVRKVQAEWIALAEKGLRA